MPAQFDLTAQVRANLRVRQENPLLFTRLESMDTQNRREYRESIQGRRASEQTMEIPMTM